MTLDREYANAAYRLGRLFALMERAQKLAIPNVKAGIRDKFFAAASSSPARIFPLLVKGAMHHLSAAQKGGASKGIAFWLEGEIGQIWAGLQPELPRTLRLEDQGRFHVGYFHQRFAKADSGGTKNPAADELTHVEEDKGAEGETQ
jgi:CRISPR-associated protein Csd1